MKTTMCFAITVFVVVLGDLVINMLVHVLAHALLTGTVSVSGQIFTHGIIDEACSLLYANVVADTRASSTYSMHTHALLFILGILNSVKHTHSSQVIYRLMPNSLFYL